MLPATFAHVQVRFECADPDDVPWVVSVLYRNGILVPHNSEHELLIATIGFLVAKLEIFSCSLQEGERIPENLLEYGINSRSRKSGRTPRPETY